MRGSAQGPIILYKRIVIMIYEHMHALALEHTHLFEGKNTITSFRVGGRVPTTENSGCRYDRRQEQGAPRGP